MVVTGSVVVAGFDGSAASARAVEWAADEASLRKARLMVCHATEASGPAAPSGSAVGGTPSLTAQRTLAAGVALAAQRHPGLVLVPRLLTGRAAPALVSASQDAELLVAGTRGTGNWQWPGLGSVSTQLAACARCPLLVVPDDGVWRPHPVIVGIDGSPASQHAAGFAIEEGWLRRVPVIAVCCWPEQRPPGSLGLASLPDRGETRREAEERVDRALRLWRRKYPDVAVTVSLRPGSPARTLREAAGQGSLLAVGARGLGGVPELLLGMVTHELLENAAGPIVVVR